MITKQAKSIPVITTILLVLLFVIGARAGQPALWETSGRLELLKGDARGVSISDTGVVMLAPRLTEVFNTQQTYVWSSAIDGQGNVYLGTGHDGKTFKITSNGSGSLLYDATELDVTALAVGRDGVLYAGTSPDGKVYRIGADGQVHLVVGSDVGWFPRGRHGRQRQTLSRQKRGRFAGIFFTRKHKSDARHLSCRNSTGRFDRGNRLGRISPARLA
jgi:WD40 repeat protein